MDLGKAFTFFYEDQQWLTKIAIGSLIVLLSPFLLMVPLLLLYGYEIAITRNVIKGVEHPLPAWEDWAGFFKDGAYLFLAKLVYALPLLLLMCISFGVFILPAFSGGSEDLAAALAGTAFIIWLLLSCLLVLLGLAFAIISPIINIQYVRSNDLSTCFRFGEIWGMVRDNFGDLAMIVLGIILANLIISVVASVSVITICGPFILGLAGPVWTRMISGHLTGQLARKLDGKAPAMELG